MFTLTVKELFARKLRLLTTAFAVLLGVAFMAGTMVFTDTNKATFDSALADANHGVDAYVRVPSAIAIGYGESGPRLDASLTDKVTTIDGVDEVALRINGYAQVVGRDGKPVGDLAKNPAFATNWVTIDELNPYHLASGTAPANDGEIVIDKASADKAGYQPGDTATVLTKGAPRQFTISGIARFGSADSPAGATAVLFTDHVAQELLATPGEADAVAVTGDPGVSQADLAAAVQAAVGNDVEVITGDQLIDEEQTSLRSVFAGFNTMMVIFALVAVFVGAFIINNTFSITVAQRTREMAMLRAIGASGRQVKRAVLAEAATIGALASAAGLVAGIGIASGLKALMGLFGVDIPDGPTVITSKAMISSVLVGLGVTVLSAWLPARRAARIAPLAALREVNVDRSATSRRRAVIGVLTVVAGGVLVAAGLAAENLSLVGVGALATFMGVAVLGPVLARPAARGRLWTLAQRSHVAGCCRLAFVADVPCDVADVEAGFGVEHGHGRASAGVGCNALRVDARSRCRARHRLRRRLTVHEATSRIGEDQRHDLSLVGVRRPRLTARESLSCLRLAARSQQLDHSGRQVVRAGRAGVLGRAEHHADFVDVDPGATDDRNPCVEVEILPTEPERLGDSPALHEQQRNDCAEAIVCGRPDQVARVL